MAVFLLKTLEGSTYVPPTATGTIFGDVPLGAFAGGLDRGALQPRHHRRLPGLAAAVLPDQSNTRGQMAVFLTKTFGLR